MDDSPKESFDSMAVKNGATERVLPLGATDFAIIRKKGDYYADKTEFLYQIAKRPYPFFLARPRRFGKTLLLHTLQCILEGRRYLFKGLWIDQSDYDWQPYPIIKLDMTQATGDDVATMESSLSNMLEGLANAEGLTLEKKIPKDMLTNLVIALNLKSGQRVDTLIDKFLSDNEGLEFEETIPVDTLLSLVRRLRATGPNVAAFLDEFLANSEDLKPGQTIPTDTFLSLIKFIKKEARQKVAILIDEYDAPIVRHIEDPPKAYQFRLALKDFYVTLKSNIDKIGHIFITGVSRFSQLSIFSDLNNLHDITFSQKFANICGLTAADLEDLISDREELTLERLIKNGYLAPGSSGSDLRNLIRDWYDGYSWDGETRVYNPWSALTCLEEAKFLNYWFSSGTPNFLHLLNNEAIMDPDWIKDIPAVTEEEAVIKDIANIRDEVLLFLGGYLTIKEVEVEERVSSFLLKVPNLEVKKALWPLAPAIDLIDDQVEGANWAKATVASLFKRDERGVEEAFSRFLSQFTHPVFKTYENLYQVLFEALLRMAKKKYDAQQLTAQGVLDIHFVSPKGERFIVDLKVYNPTKPDDSPKTKLGAKSVDPPKKPRKPRYIPPPESDTDKAILRKSMTSKANAALRQIRAKYADKYIGEKKTLTLVALVITRRNFVLAKFEVIDPIKSVSDQKPRPKGAKRPLS